MYELGLAKIFIALIGTFFLSIEAIKIKNIKRLRVTIAKLPEMVWGVAGAVVIVALAVCAIGTILAFLFLDIAKLIALSFFGNPGYNTVVFWAMSGTFGVAIVALFFALIAYIVNLLIDQIIIALISIERRTFTGIFGIVGFLLVFISSMIELGIHMSEHAHHARLSPP